MATILYTHDVFKDHLVPNGHPERPDRIKAVEKALDATDFDTLIKKQAPKADPKTYLYAHPENYLKAIENAVPDEGLHRIDGDTTLSPKSWQAVSHAVGAANAAVDDIMNGDASNAFIAARPPGHHAEKQTAMGFCFVNAAAVAARHAQKAHGVERVAIIDFDVHHGNGTQDIFYDDPTVLYASSHQLPLFPGSGALNEVGAGNIFNAPLSAGCDGESFKEAYKSRILPALENFKPDFVIISAGFDAHYRDPLANINLVADDFNWVTGKLMDIATKNCNDRLVSLLEGGYDLEGLSESAASHVKRLMAN